MSNLLWDLLLIISNLKSERLWGEETWPHFFVSLCPDTTRFLYCCAPLVRHTQ